jgi:hypothetical protein
MQIENCTGNDNTGHAQGTETLGIYVPCVSYLLATGHRYVSLFLINIKMNCILAGVTHIHRFLWLRFGE